MEIFSISGLMYKLKKLISPISTGTLFSLFLCAVLLIPKFSVSAQQVKSAALEMAQKYLIGRGEVIIRFVKPETISLEQLSTSISIQRFRQDTITAYANESGFNRFLQMDIPFEIMPPPSLNPAIFRTKRLQTDDWRNTYPSYSSYIDLMEGFAADHPHLCSLVQFGTSINGKKLLALKISDHADIREPEPVVLYTSSMHGNELLGYVLMLRLIDYLLTNYENDMQIQQLVDQVEIWINPLANPDGSYFLSDTSVWGATRFNANQQDLNRNFPVLGDGDWESRNREPETMAMMNFMEDLELVLAANFHGGAELVNYPWDTWIRLHPDDTWYWYISRCYADTVHAYSPVGYMTDEDNGITNGYAWYSINGGRQDYTNYYLHAREVTIELSEENIPPENSLDAYWNYHRESLLQYIGRTLSGITGVVTDSLTGNPLEAEIWIEDHDYDSSYVLSDPSTGIFYRLLTGQHYTLKVAAPEFASKKKTVQVREGELTSLEVKLLPAYVQTLYPNPFSDFLYFRVEEAGYNLIVEFFDLLGRKIGQTEQPVYHAGRQRIETEGIPFGVYAVRTIYGNQSTRQVMIKMPE